MAAGPLMALSLGSTAVGTGISAASTIAGGAAKQQEANYEAAQLRQNSGADVAGAQRQMFDTQQKTRLAVSKATAQAGASGVNAGVGSPAANTAALVRRGTYQSMMDLWNGQNQATADLNKAASVQYSGTIAKQASTLSALGTIAGGAGQMFNTLMMPYRYAAYGGYGGGGGTTSPGP
jgi:hypothetical protein